MKKTSSKTMKNSKATVAASAHQIGSMLDDIVGSGVHSAISALEELVHEKIQVKGPEYLEKALKQTNVATAKLLKWSKKHPIKTAAAAAALVGVSAFLYSTMKHAETRSLKTSA
jgi:hypothetical protein